MSDTISGNIIVNDTNEIVASGPIRPGPTERRDSSAPRGPSFSSPRSDPREGERSFGSLEAAVFRDQRLLVPRPWPKPTKWDPRQPDGPHLMSPAWCPQWVYRAQQKLPWYNLMKASGGGPWLSLPPTDFPFQNLLKEFRWRWENNGDRWFLYLRFSAIATVVIAFLIVNVILATDAFVVEPVDEIYDVLFEATRRANEWLRTSEGGHAAVMFIASLMMDATVLLLLGSWIVLGDSFRLPIAFGLLYFLRFCIRSLCLLPFPEGYIWAPPMLGSVAWPSLTVPYHPSDEFFYSGHVGCAVLATVEHYQYRCWWAVAFSAVTAVVQFWMMIITRGHYTIDMFTGAIVAHWVHGISQWLTRPVDQWFAFPPRPVILPPKPGFFPLRAVASSDGQTTRAEGSNLIPPSKTRTHSRLPPSAFELVKDGSDAHDTRPRQQSDATVLPDIADVVTEYEFSSPADSSSSPAASGSYERSPARLTKG